MSLMLIPNNGPDLETYPYFIQADFTNKIIRPYHIFTLPVHSSFVQKGFSAPKYTYSVEMCGYRLAAKNPTSLIKQVDKLIKVLTHNARLPSYVFIARPSNQLYPVYTIDDEVMAVTQDGPHFRHVELATIRRNLSTYLHSVRILRNDKLHVRGVRTRNLALTRPIFYLKKRLEDENEFWAPVFVASDGNHIYANAASARREVPITTGEEVLLLREVVAQALIADERLRNNFDLRPDRIQAETWDKLCQTFTPTHYRLGVLNTDGIEHKVFQHQDYFLAAEKRRSEERYGLFFGEDLADLQTRVAQDHLRRGMIRTETHIQLLG